LFEVLGGGGVGLEGLHDPEHLVGHVDLHHPVLEFLVEECEEFLVGLVGRHVVHLQGLVGGEVSVPFEVFIDFGCYPLPLPGGHSDHEDCELVADQEDGQHDFVERIVGG